MYIIRKLIVKLDLKFLLSYRQQKFVNKTALMHARVLAAMSHFSVWSIAHASFRRTGENLPRERLNRRIVTTLSRHCRGNYRKLP